MSDKNIVWTTLDGRKIKLYDLTDTHLANIIHHFNINHRITNKDIKYLKDEAIRRKLKDKFLKIAPFGRKDRDKSQMDILGNKPTCLSISRLLRY